MSESNSSISILTNIFTDPKRALTDMQQTYPIILPLLLLIIPSAALMFMLFANIDYVWYVDRLVEATAGDTSKAEQDQVRQGMQMMSASSMGWMLSITVLIGTPITFAIVALYFVIVSNITNDGFQFKQWFSFVCWTSMPMLISTIAAFMVLLMNDNGQIIPEALNPLTLNELFFGMDPSQGLGKILASIGLTTFWSIALMTIGYAKWTDKSTAKAFSIVAAPYVIYYGISLLMM